MLPFDGNVEARKALRRLALRGGGCDFKLEPETVQMDTEARLRISGIR